MSRDALSSVRPRRAAVNPKPDVHVSLRQAPRSVQLHSDKILLDRTCHLRNDCLLAIPDHLQAIPFSGISGELLASVKVLNAFEVPDRCYHDLENAGHTLCGTG